jgi:uncharacterized protein YqjF (DUF2071 family)
VSAGAGQPGRAPTSVAAPDVRMSWTNLLFMHWPVDPALLRARLPAELELDLFDRRAWVAIVPFRMERCAFRGVPPLPGTRTFYECNVRTYARWRGAPGVWFLSLDAQSLLPVLGGRWLWSLNYRHARFDVRHTDDEHDYALRLRAPWPSAHLRVRWRTGEALPPSAPGSIEHFFTERYWLFTRRRGSIMAGRIEHEPWPLRHALVEDLHDGLLPQAGLTVKGEPMALASEGVDVLGWKLRADTHVPAGLRTP